ncbi:MAG: hypothetical protein RBR38_10465 [Desulfomicrobium apsheronum]|nr:hypothetical protein [Desulfomicrobium apsheronum]
MKSIIHTILDCCLVALCAAWLVFGVDGAGNIYTAWAWFVFCIALIMILVANKWDEMKSIERPVWRKHINTGLSLSQLGILFWHGEMLIGGIMTFSCLVFAVYLDSNKAVKG